jgi:hypothetical protein
LQLKSIGYSCVQRCHLPLDYQLCAAAVSPCVTIWTIYQNPDDYPDSWVLRGHEVLPGAWYPHRVCFVARTLDAVRAKLPPGTLRIGRAPDDHPSICESWVAYADIHEIDGLIDEPPLLAGSGSLSPGLLVGALTEQPHQNRISEAIREKSAPTPSSGLSADADMVPEDRKISFELEVRLAMISWHITEGEARIRRIMASIERMRESGFATELADNLLNTMLVSLSLLIDAKAKIESALRFSLDK